MKFSIRDLLWLILVICVALGCWRTSAQHAEERLAERIRKYGYFDDRKWMAVMFPIKDSKGRQKAMMRVWTVDDAPDHAYDIYYPGDIVSGGAVKVHHLHNNPAGN